MDIFQSKGEKFIFNPSLDWQPAKRPSYHFEPCGDTRVVENMLTRQFEKFLFQFVVTPAYCTGVVCIFKRKKIHAVQPFHSTVREN